MAVYTTRELIESRSTTRQVGENGTVRVYQVDATADLALNADALPKLGEKLPWEPAQIVTALSADYESGSVATSRVMVRYSSSGRWGGINPADTTYQSWTISFIRVAQQIPYAIKNPYQYHYLNNGTDHFVISYPIQHESHWETRVKYIRRVRIKSFNAQTMTEIIRKQTNKLHKIYGLWYLFTTGDIVEVARKVWDVTYTWEYDAGTNDIYEDIADTMQFPHIDTPSWILNPAFYPAFKMARPPFHQIATIPIWKTSVTPNVPDWPKFVAICGYDRTIPSGYLGLPGFSL